MFYGLFIYNAGTNGSINPFRLYKSDPLTETDIKNVDHIMDQATKATGLPIAKHAGFGFRADNAWDSLLVTWDKKDYTDAVQLTKNDARSIAEQVLNDLVATQYWEDVFSGTKDSFASLDFNAFSYIDESTDNTNLKVTIGKKVYVNGQRDKTYIYQGRPNNYQIKKGKRVIFDGHRTNLKVFATDENIIAVDAFSLDDYEDTVEVYPLPTMGTARKGLGTNQFFARAKDGKNVTYEALGKTESKARTLVALQLAFEDSPAPHLTTDLVDIVTGL